MIGTTVSVVIYYSYSLVETKPLFDAKLGIMIISRPMSGTLLNGIIYTHVSSLVVVMYYERHTPEIALSQIKGRP